MASQTFTYPTSGSAYLLEQMTWHVEDSVMLSVPALGGPTRTYETPGARLVCSLTYPVQSTDERREIRGWWAKAGQMKNRVTLYDIGYPTPRGTLTGSPLVKTTIAVGAESVIVKSMSTGTLKRGDMIGLTDGLHIVTDDATPTGGEATVNFAPPVRSSVAADSAVAWNQPTGVFMVTSAPRITFDRVGPHPQFTVDLIEVGA